MAPSIEINLSGNLGERHRCLNDLVLDAYQQNIPLHVFHETSTLERLLKIDLASKQRNADYILHTLKDDDMLYISRALKSLWLFEPEHSDIINPSFLEHELFTHMRLQAVNKMRHWIQIHLRDPVRCSEFYLFYKDKDFNVAVKFLWHCSNEYISSETVNVLREMTPKHLKLISEKVPKVAQVYFENLKQDQIVLKYYLDNDLKFYENVKFILKFDPDVFFYIIENFFVFEKFSAFSSEITKFIIKHHKNKFMIKPELYTRWFLDMKTLAKCLDSEEVQDLVIKLAKAEFLGSWFSYKSVEPLVNRLSNNERTAFKKLVFVDKAFEPTVKEWPYPIPVPPKLKVPQTFLFEDRVIKPPECIIGTKCSAKNHFGQFKTLLEQLFDEYRFTSFQQTLIQLRKRLKREASPQNRQSMLLVLVSKSGGRAEDLAKLIDLLLYHKNEPAHLRAAIIRSLVKRAFVWRLGPEHWGKLLKWGHGLGLDGLLLEPEPDNDNTPQNQAKLLDKDRIYKLVGQTFATADVACIEVLHAVIIRDILSDATPNELVWGAFMDNFSPLAEYTLSVDERSCISFRLPTMLLANARSSPIVALNRLNLLLDTLSAYHIRFDKFPGTIEVILTTAKSDFESAKGLLSRLYKGGVGRKTFMKEYFEMMQTDASYVNALKHDISILESTAKFEELFDQKKLKHEKFLQKLALYFSEKDGLGQLYRAKLELRAGTKPNKMLARPLAMLAVSDFPSLLRAFDSASPKTPQRQMAAALRSNAHVVRLPFDLESFGWNKAGAKAIANQVVTCRHEDLERYLTGALSWSRTLRLALILAKRVNKEHEAYETFAFKRPSAALKAALKYFQLKGIKLDLRIWNIVKPVIAKYDQQRCHYSITNIESVPTVIKAEYCVFVYRAYKMSSNETALSILYHIPAMLHEVDDQFILEIVEAYLHDECTEKMILRRNYLDQSCSYLHVTLIGKYLLLSTTAEMMEERFQRIGIPFFKRIAKFWKKFVNSTSSIHTVSSDLWVKFMWSLEYKKVFFDPKYVLCQTVFEKVIDWMHSFFPIEKWLEYYMEIHLTTIYLKTVRCCLKQGLQMYSDEGVDMLGNVFGKLVASEVQDLTQKYFPSIIPFYEEKLNIFLGRYYYRCQNSDQARGIDNFAKAMLKGMLSAKESESAFILANYIYNRLCSKCKDEDIDNIIKSYEKSEKIELRFCALVDATRYW